MTNADRQAAVQAVLDSMTADQRSYFDCEIRSMNSHFPDAVMGVLESTGELYWLVPADIPVGQAGTWMLMVIYGKPGDDAPGYGNKLDFAFRVLPLKPDLDTLKRRAHEAGRGPVPHIWMHAPSGCACLDIATRQSCVTSAVSAAAHAIRWCVHYEAGLLDQAVWNRF